MNITNTDIVPLITQLNRVFIAVGRMNVHVFRKEMQNT